MKFKEFKKTEGEESTEKKKKELTEEQKEWQVILLNFDKLESNMQAEIGMQLTEINDKVLTDDKSFTKVVKSIIDDFTKTRRKLSVKQAGFLAEKLGDSYPVPIVEESAIDWEIIETKTKEEDERKEIEKFAEAQLKNKNIEFVKECKKVADDKGDKMIADICKSIIDWGKWSEKQANAIKYFAVNNKVGVEE